MMLDDFSSQIKLEQQRDEETTSSSTVRLSSSLNSLSESESQSQTELQIDSSLSLGNHSLLQSSATNSVSSSSSSALGELSSGSVRLDRAIQGVNSIQSHLQQAGYQQQKIIREAHNQQHAQDQYFLTQVANFNYDHQQHQQQGHELKFNPIPSSSSQVIDSSLTRGSLSLGKAATLSLVSGQSDLNMNVESSQHANLVPSVHNSDHHSNMHYSMSAAKNVTNPSPSNMALNFSHDLLLQTSHHSHQNNNGQHNQDSDTNEIKSQLTNSFELDSGSLMQSAAVGMNMWKNSMGLNHFKHPAIADQSFLPATDMNSFSSWTHSNNIGHQTTHHILDSQHLIGYPHQHHQRNIGVPNQNLVGPSLTKSQSCAADQASFMLNSINHQAQPTSQNPGASSHHTTPHPTHDNLNLRSHALDHSAATAAAATYNLALNDNQFYNNSRADNRSHVNNIKTSSLMTDRSMQMSLSNHHHHHHHPHHHHASQLPYHGTVHTNGPQPTSSHHVAGSSSGGGSRNIGTFRCPHCSEIFSVRSIYQNHLKTHSQEKGEWCLYSDVECDIESF